ncbi:hypothetical protein GYMLUDRAFT_53814 [Collybiopsis luxurians FD-317 M1]|nr:hypothetical protein GYMLUDRAFT_53814 [Collybiopsis luxurians FD-317 M1]
MANANGGQQRSTCKCQEMVQSFGTLKTLSGHCNGHSGIPATAYVNTLIGSGPPLGHKVGVDSENVNLQNPDGIFLEGKEHSAQLNADENEFLWDILPDWGMEENEKQEEVFEEVANSKEGMHEDNVMVEDILTDGKSCIENMCPEETISYLPFLNSEIEHLKNEGRVDEFLQILDEMKDNPDCTDQLLHFMPYGVCAICLDIGKEACIRTGQFFGILGSLSQNEIVVSTCNICLPKLIFFLRSQPLIGHLAIINITMETSI